MQHLFGKKIILIPCLFFTFILFSQRRGVTEHNPNYDNNPWHFGISIVPNTSKTKVLLAKDFHQQDSVRTLLAEGFAGFGFGGIVDLRFAKYWTVRYLPQLTFSQRNFNYTFSDREQVAKTESVALDQHFIVRHHSVRHGNFRFYILAGGFFSIDFASDEKKIRSPNLALVPYKRNSLYYEVGVGSEFFSQWTNILTEIKWCNSITNMVSKDPYIYTHSIDRIQARMFQISFHFQN